MANPLIPVGSVDALIASRLPGWLTSASAEHVRKLHASLRQQQAAQTPVQRLLGNLIPLQIFAAQLLQPALAERGLADLDVYKGRLRLRSHVRIPSYVAAVPEGVVVHEFEHSLLAAALHNFEDSETQTLATLEGALVLDAQGHPAGITYKGFTRLCRRLDIGGKYQAYLKEWLLPPGAQGQVITAQLQEAHRASLEATVRMTAIRGEIDQRTYRQFLPIMADKPVVASEHATLIPRALRLFGKQVSGVVVFEARRLDLGGTPLEEVIAWIPGDPHGALTVCASWQALYQQLGRSMRTPGYREFFLRFISKRDLPGFSHALERANAAASEDAALSVDGRHEAIDPPLFEYLGQRQIETLLDDASVLAVPTADVDRAERARRLLFYRNAGLDLLGLASFFVPGLGLPLLAITAAELADEVYQGYSAWRLGDREAALAHLVGVAQNVIATGLTVGAGAAAASLERQAFVDGLAPVRDQAGRLRLASLETAHELEAGHELLWRLDETLRPVTVQAATDLLQITGYEPAQLRRLHIEQAPAPARLLDAAQRYRLHQTLPGMRAEVFEAHLAGQQAQLQPAEQVLQRDFPGLTARSCKELVDQASGLDIEQMLARQRVPLPLAERARWQLREQRLDRACAGLCQPAAVTRDTERLALGLLDAWVPWSVHIELREGSLQGERLAHGGSQQASEVRSLSKRDEGYLAVDAGGQPLANATTADSLLQGLMLLLDEHQLIQLGNAGRSPSALAEALLVRASTSRDRAAGLIGLAPVGGGLRPPVRWGDGRLGYPLSGRGESSGQAIRRGLRQLFPTFTSTQIESYLSNLAVQGVDPWAHYNYLQEQLGSLRQALHAWAHEPVGVAQAYRRRQVASRIRRSWRRKQQNAEGEYILEIDGERVGLLPVLPAGLEFPHVTQLRLRRMGLVGLEADFLARFTGLRQLDLRDNQLTSIPAGVANLPELRELRLGDNRIVLDAEGNRNLNALGQLRVLDLSENPLGMAPQLRGLNLLRRLSLRATGLTSMPPIALEHATLESIDLRDNRIHTLTDTAIAASTRRLARLALHDNPLEAQTSEAIQQLSPAIVERVLPTRRHVETASAAREIWLQDLDEPALSRARLQWKALADEPGSLDLFRFLADLASSVDYRQQPREMRRRVQSILEVCEHNGQVREAVFQQASGPRSCTDRLLLILSNLEVRAMVVQRTAGLESRHAEPGLLELGRSLYRLDEVDRIAAQHIERLRTGDPYALVDDIEIYLAFRVGLADALGLPGQPAQMHFAHFADVSPPHLRDARTAVLSAENVESLSTSLAAREFWQEYLRNRHDDRFEALNEPFHARLEALEAMVGGSSERVYLDQVDALMAQRNVAERQLVLRLTREAYARSGLRSE
ncbi:hypothetical protein J2W83_001291 [Pseudomonas hunanensis]|uniref:Uncharacterized protein n=1 Tax=Pseudomonas hunanensis TaxID=1247546 RepID=A0ACC6JZU1_9PSED|nr:NEL-type E3 ubiquitin ligase domain-containing protein [Pseudomonas hunanensis]MDR6711697.1 hypothetical protein [Pseudomonas hunanensis]